MIKKNCLLIGENSEISKFLIPELKKNYSITSTYNKKKNKINQDFSLKLNLENTSSKNLFIKKLKKLQIKFDLILFIAAITPSPNRNKNSFLSNLNYKNFDKYLKINCYSYIYITECLILEKLLNDKSKIFYFTSRAGSIDERGKKKHHLPGGDLFYRISKSALNCAVKNIAYDLSSLNYSFISYHPGYIDYSDLKTHKKNMTTISNNFMNIINSKKSEISGQFLDNKGMIIKW